MGAWIETVFEVFDRDCDASHPGWVRGLKHRLRGKTKGKQIVAPRVGAWIETIGYPFKSTGEKSHPVWVRGLKPNGFDIHDTQKESRTPCGCVD